MADKLLSDKITIPSKILSSLNTNSHLLDVQSSFELNKYESYKSNKNKLNKIQSNKNIQLDNYPTNTINSLNLSNYDKECIERYGDKTCILIEISNKDSIKESEKTYQIRYMDKIKLNQHFNVNSKNEYLSSKLFYKFIPHLLTHNYTVVVVENIELKKEITAIHKPTGEFYSILNFY